jgi:leucyl-tRNA synthetase
MGSPEKTTSKGYWFRRQKPLSNYIVDFYGPKPKLIIEVDGKIHEKQVSEDHKRQKALEALGFSFIRFSNEDALYRIDYVLRTILEWIDKHEKDTPSRSAGHPSMEG